METDAERELLQLWVLRALEPTSDMRRLFKDGNFKDDDVAELLGLEHWIETDNGHFDPKAIRRELREKLRVLETRQPPIGLPDRIQDNFKILGDTLSLDALSVKVLQLTACFHKHGVFADAIDLLGNLTERQFIDTWARMLRESAEAIGQVLRAEAPLIDSGILRWGWANRKGARLDMLSYGMERKLLTECFSLDNFLTGIVAPAPSPTLCYNDYPQIRETISYLRPFIRKVLKSRRRGVNIFIHGAPGTGKSELSRVIAREMRCDLYEVPSVRDSDKPAEGNERLNALKTVQNLLYKQRSLIVFDEAEDVFSGSIFQPSHANKRKAWMNRLLESNPCPTIWISNRVHGIDPAFLRRFDFVFELPSPPLDQRKRMYRKLCKQRASNPFLRKLASLPQLTPAIVARASEVATEICQTDSRTEFDGAVQHIVSKSLKTQGEIKAARELEQAPATGNFDIRFLNADLPLNSIARDLRRSPACRICLYGPPGTGKTSFGHWLSESLERPLVEAKASEIISSFVGETEANLAELFTRARFDGAILIIDEVDTFLQDRRQAVRSWEVSQVNEILTQIERFDGIFIASTNFTMDGLDQAALRRFDFKVYVDYLMREQAARLLDVHCKQLGLGKACDQSRRIIATINNITPGDFANVARQHRFRRFENPHALARQIAQECELKEGIHQTMGFV